MPEAEQQVYLELVQELLDCSQGQEQELLAMKPELVNERLVETLLLVAEMREGGNNADWLRGLARKLGLELGGIEDEKQPDSEDFGEADLYFLNTLIEAEQNDSSQVQQLFTQNLQRLTPQLGAAMKWLMAEILKKHPEDTEYYAALIENIVIKLHVFQLGKSTQNIEIVIAVYTVVLTIWTQENNPEQWARTQGNLANAYRARIRGDKAGNLELSIVGYQSALEIYTKVDFPMQWAMIQDGLANTYSERIRGDKAENLECSIAGYQSALEIFTKADFPMQWAGTQNNLATAYNQRIRGDKA
jgi:Tetratricopeptide repeat